MSSKVTMKLSEYDALRTRVAELEVKLEKAEDEFFFLKQGITQVIDDEFDHELKSQFKGSYPRLVDAREISKLIGLDWDEMVANWKEERKKVLAEMEAKENAEVVE